MSRHPAIEIIGHRGFAARAPENTLASLRMAIEAGARALEFDVHLSRDGVPVVMHDFTLERTTDGRGRVDETDFADLRVLDAGSWFDEGFAGERIPTLREALELAAAHRVPAGRMLRIYPEIKGWREDADIGLIVDELRRTGWEPYAHVISLDWDALDLVRRASPALAIGYIYDDARLHDDALRLAAKDGNAFIDPDYRLLLDAVNRAADARGHGVDVACWTVDDVADARRLVERGVTRLTTNEVETMLQAFAQGHA